MKPKTRKRIVNGLIGLQLLGSLALRDSPLKPATTLKEQLSPRKRTELPSRKKVCWNEILPKKPRLILPDSIPKGKVSLLVDLSEKKLFFQVNGKNFLVFPVAGPGKGMKKLLGTFTLGKPVFDPSFNPTTAGRKLGYVPAKPGSQTNPLGSTKIIIKGNFLLHGTNNQITPLERQWTTGCVKLLNEHIEWIARHLPPKTKITITD